MPSIRGYSKGIDNKALKNAIDKYTAHIVTIAKQAGLEAMKEIRTAAVNSWYKRNSHNAMNSATVYEANKLKQYDNKVEITITSYVDIDKYEHYKREASENNLYSSPYESVKMWRERHEKNGWKYLGIKQPQMDDDIYQKSFPAVDMKWSIGEYLFVLPWKEGIKGLPDKERHTGTKWINPAKRMKVKHNLETRVDNYFKKRWAKTVNKMFAEKMSK